MSVGGHWDHFLPFPTISACPIAPLALRLVAGREGKQPRIPEDPAAGVDTAL